MTTVTDNQIEDEVVARTIKRQISTSVFMTLGASNFVATERGGLRFQASILPFNSGGNRPSRARRMFVQVNLNALDFYDIRVCYVNRSIIVDHFTATDVSVDRLNDVLFSLDYDGSEVCNPRI